MPEADVRRMLSETDAVESYAGVIVRDMRALWNVEVNMAIIAAARRSRDWYRGEKGAMPPEDMLSAVTRPGGDCDGKGAHRLLAFARSARSADSQETFLFRLFKVSSEKVLDELEETAAVRPLREARLQLKELFAFLAKGASVGLAAERFTQVLTEKVRGYIQVCREISAAYEEVERDLLGCPAADPHVRRIEAAVEKVGADVGRLLQRAKVAPVGLQTQRWVLDRWNYYTAHPEACVTNVVRRRVYVRDVWETVRETARSEHGIATQEDFARIRRTAQKTRERSLAGVPEKTP